MVVENNNRQDSVVKTGYITIFAPPVPEFASMLNEGCTPLLTKFTDKSQPGSGSINKWEWDLGDGRLSNEQHPAYTYSGVGSFNVTLKVSNTAGCSASVQKTAYVKTNGVTAQFTATDASTCVQAKVNLTNTTTGNGAISYQWRMGDGGIITAKQQTYQYADGGNYTVQLNAVNEYGCRDSVSRVVKLPMLVSAGFNADTTAFCKAPATVQFTNKHVEGNVYLWSFGDKGSAETANPTHIYTDTGRYTVKLIVANMNGCMDSVIKQNYITAGRQSVWFSGLPDSNCTAFTKKFEPLILNETPIVSWRWNFGDGTTSTAAAPTHTFYNTGYYDISLTTQSASGCRDTIKLANAIRVDTKPKASFSVAQNMVCGNKPIGFTDFSSTGVTGWEWSFGDGSREYIRNPEHIFTDTGWMNISLAAYKGGCADTFTQNKMLYVQPALACFRIILDCTNPHRVKFFNCSKGADSYLWEFGDGTTTTDSLPVHSYAAAGTYEIKLTAYNKTTGCAYTQSREVVITSVEPAFFASDTLACAGSNITFTSFSKGSVYRHIWDFGDGNMASQKDNTVQYAYAKPGNYSVRLITSDQVNCRDTVEKKMYIKITGPEALFETAKSVIGINTALAFNDKSQAYSDNAIRQWVWYPGDGTVAAQQTKAYSYAYPKTGLYYPALKITDAKGCTDSFRLKTPVAATKVKLRFEVAKDIVCPGGKVKFYVQPFSQSLKYEWYFGDGGKGTGLNPEYQYNAEGLFDVKVVVTDEFGNQDSLLRPGFIRVQAPVAAFSTSDAGGTCPPVNISFTNYSKNIVSSVWDFGDSSTTNNNNPSHFYTQPGTYWATLTVTGTGGCIQQQQKEIVVKGPSGKLEYDSSSFCTAAAIHFKAITSNTISYTWDFGDGQTAQLSDSNITHTYTNGGNYLPKLILKDENGCMASITGSKTIRIAKTSAVLQVQNTTVCDSSMVYFSAGIQAENDIVKSYNWHFGDGTISTAIAPAHSYAASGKYTPMLAITTAAGCRDTITSVVPVEIKLSPKISFTTTGSGCTPLVVELLPSNQSADTANVQWHWNFGNGYGFTGSKPAKQLYSNPGTYTIQATATAANGCISIARQSVEAYTSPFVMTVNDTSICAGTTLTLTATGATKYTWLDAEGNLAGTTPAITVQPGKAGMYIVKGANANGCSAADTVQVAVIQKQQLKYIANVNTCIGESKKLSADGTDTYEWYPSAGLSNNRIAAPVVSVEKSSTYRVTGGDSKGCFTDTGYIQVNVYPTPFVEAGSDITITAGTAVDLVPKVSEDVTEALWSPTSAIFRNQGNGITVRPEETTEYTVEVKNAGGCRAKDKIKVQVACSGSDVFIPNTFSPNGDGNNDVFYVRGKGKFTVKSLRIFGRWGQEVFNKTNFIANDPAAGWDGTVKGTKLQSDVFVYFAEVICSTGGIINLTGNVSLVR
jgi:gliding motility-associated-like protein